MAEQKNNMGIILLIVVALIAVFGFIMWEAEQPDTPAEMAGEQIEAVGDEIEDTADEMDNNM